MPLRQLLLIGICLSVCACATRDDVYVLSQSQSQTQATLATQTTQLSTINKQLTDISQQGDRQQAQLARLSAEQRRLQTALPTMARQSCPEVKIPDCPPDPQLEDRIIFGAVETFYLAPANIYLDARIDTGATTSSLNAENLEKFERDGDPWARFQVREPETGEPIQMEHPIQRFVLIKQASAEEEDRRPVVNIPVGIGNKLYRSDFTLRDRSTMDFQLLIGRTFLKDIVLVDVSRNKVQSRFKPPDSGGRKPLTPKADKPPASSQNGAD